MRPSQSGRRGDVTHCDTLFSRQWGKVVKIGNVGQTNNGNIDAAALWLYGDDWRIQVSRILLRQAQIRHKRNDAQHGQGTALFENAYAFLKEGRITPKLIDDQPLYQALFLGCEEPEGTE